MDRRENSYNSIGIELLIISKKNNNIKISWNNKINYSITLHLHFIEKCYMVKDRNRDYYIIEEIFHVCFSLF